LVRRRVAALAFFTILLLGIGGSVSAQTAPTEFKPAKVPSAHIKLEYPGSWTVVVLTPGLVRAQRKLTVKNNPRLESVFDEAAATESLKHTKFAAADLEAKLAGQPSPIVEVQAGGGFSLPLEEMASQVKEAYKKAGATDIKSTIIRVSGTKSMRLDTKLAATAPDGSMVKLRVAQLMAPIGRRSVVVTIGAPDDEDGAATIDHIIQSVREI
jgi:hypothetical protein